MNAAERLTVEDLLLLGLVAQMRAMPALTGEPEEVAVATVMRMRVLAGVINLTQQGGDKASSVAAHERWMGVLADAPTEAAWWLEHRPATPTGLAVAMADGRRAAEAARRRKQAEGEGTP